MMPEIYVKDAIGIDQYLTSAFQTLSIESQITRVAILLVQIFKELCHGGHLGEMFLGQSVLGDDLLHQQGTVRLDQVLLGGVGVVETSQLNVNPAFLSGQEDTVPG